ncbi:MAG TPA: NfeD family protein [Thermodesulfobacteriota bacterium]|nr:NfeD family protein [Thermodesulfobacteriota bacterium]
MFGLGDAWTWALIGIILIIIEVISVTFFFVFLSVGAFITALAVVLGVESFATQVIIFSISSVLLIVVLRKSAKQLFARHGDMPPEYVGQKVEVIEDIVPGREGYVTYRGSRWIAYSDEKETIPAGSFVEVVSSDGIKLKIKKT